MARTETKSSVACVYSSIVLCSTIIYLTNTEGQSTIILKADDMINGVVKVTKDPMGPTGPDLKYQRVVNTQITNRIHLAISLDVTTGIPG
jgi:hypothetical protein